MPRTPFTIQQVYIADGFADDCDELIHRCSRVDVLSYQTFCIYYKELNFASVFQGRKTNAEIAELSEELLQIAKYYMVLDTSNFEESVAGLFLVYALLNLQPYPRFAPLRIVPDDLPAIERIQRVARRDRRHDVLYVLGSVLIRGPVQYQAAVRPRGLEGSIRKYLEGFCNIDSTGVRPKGVYFRQNEELDIIRDMTGIFKRYSQAKARIPGLQKRVLSYSNDNLPEELGSSLKRVINGVVDEGSSAEQVNAVQELKQRAMKNLVGTVRHLNSACQRSPKKEIQQSKEPRTSTEPVAARKQEPTRRPKKPVEPRKPKSKKARKHRKYSTSSSSEETEDEIEDNWCIETEGSLREIEKPDEQVIHVEIDSLPSLITTESDGKLVEIEIIDEMKKTGKTKGNDAKKSNETIKKIEITKGDNVTGDEITKGDNVTGVEMTKGDKVTGDKLKETKKLNERKKGKGIKKRNETTKRKEMKQSEKKKENLTAKEDEIAKIDGMQKGDKNDTNEKEENKQKGKKRGRPKKGEAVQKSDDEIFKRPLRMSPRLKKLSKREMKKPILKSKFKKMGMLPVANFEDK